ncbi:hypothetical protein EG329_006257 [Mollisiaceae sp. DMI_Dod_QoI]|nr:hypothetical protein EG329_006257 [Helotiales sp. DMI_Dod_QoI]
MSGNRLELTSATAVVSVEASSESNSPTSTSAVWVIEDSSESESETNDVTQPRPASRLVSQAEFDQSERADQPRLPWNWKLHGKTSSPYIPVILGKWWSRTQAELDAMAPTRRKQYDHIGRIMETELGKQLFNQDRCSFCRQEGKECWVYTEKGAKQLVCPRDACTRCRINPHKGGCSKAKRGPRVKIPQPPPGLRTLAPAGSNVITAERERSAFQSRPSLLPAPPAPSPLPTPSTPSPTFIHFEIISPGTKLPNLDDAELHLLRKKQERLCLNETATINALPQKASLRNALAATLIFAQYEAGTAVCIDEAGWILTCAHCFGDNEEEYNAANKRKWLLFYNGLAVLGECRVWDIKRDLALLKVVAIESDKGRAMSTFPFVKLATSTPSTKMPIFCIGQPGRDDLESTSKRKTKYNLVEVSEGRFRGMVPGVDLQDNSEIGTMKHDAWTYWGHSGAPLIAAADGTLIGLHSSWDDKTAMRHGIPQAAIKEFLEKKVPTVMKLLMSIDIDNA